MKAPLSLFACLAICLALLGYRSYYSEIGGGRKELKVTQWDAFGYYLYLPATIIYQDYKKLDWAPAIDQTYNVTGGDGLPVQQLDNGNKVCKYLCGVAIMQAPLFAFAHGMAAICGCPADGFSPIYQHALAFGVILYCVLALFLLRHILLRYYSDGTASVTLLLLCLATNFIQYAAVDNGLSHAWIFPLYVLILATTIKWHERPAMGWALLTGYLIGLATICRPTEAIALFIPLLWSTHSKEDARAKWALVRANHAHILLAVLGGILGILPQLLYWKSVTGSFIYDVGSKWMFFDPWFRVLIGWEKGWFIYTPVTILFVLGLFFIRKYSFRYAALVFCLLNIWIVIAWEDWRYGASYSARALVQSYPVFALPLGAMISRFKSIAWRMLLGVAAVYLIGANLFQTVQYNSMVLHYNDMNDRYYSRIYLNPAPSPLDMSLLDTDAWIPDERRYRKQVIATSQGTNPVHIEPGDTVLIGEPVHVNGDAGGWLKIEAVLDNPSSHWKNGLYAELQKGSYSKKVRIRLDNPVGKSTGNYAFYLSLPQNSDTGLLKIHIDAASGFNGRLKQLTVTELSR